MRALVLSGGGSKGAYEAGFLQVLMGVKGNAYDIYCGTSVGAINAAFLAQTKKGSPSEAVYNLRKMWESVSTAKVRKNWFPFSIVSALWKQSVYDSRPLQNWIRAGLNVDAIRKSGNQLRVVATSWDSGEITVASELAPDIADWVIASSAFPVMLSPVEIGGQLWTDGGLRNVTPLGEAIRAGATDVDVLMCSDPFAPSGFNAKSAKAVPGLLLRAIDVLSDQVSRADLQICGLKNDLATIPGSIYSRVNVNVYAPKAPLPFDSLDFSPENIQKMYAMGMADATSSLLI